MSQYYRLIYELLACISELDHYLNYNLSVRESEVTKDILKKAILVKKKAHVSAARGGVASLGRVP